MHTVTKLHTGELKMYLLHPSYFRSSIQKEIENLPRSLPVR